MNRITTALKAVVAVPYFLLASLVAWAWEWWRPGNKLGPDPKKK